MSKPIKIILGIFVSLWLVLAGFLLYAKDNHVVPILMYHHVDYQPQQKEDLNTVSPESFERQMKYLKDNHYNVIGFDAFITALTDKRELPKKTVVLSFDDGYEDNYTYALPILKKYQFPAIIFLPSDLIGTKGFMTWDQVKLVADLGIEMGSHSRTHMYLPDYPSLELLRSEIAGSKTIIEEKLGKPVQYFCYPVGGFTQEIKELVKNVGYKAAVTTNRGFAKNNSDLYELKRIRIKDSDSEFDLWAKLSGYYNLFRKPKSPHTEN